MSILPPEVRAGYVYDRVLRAIGDRPYDEDRLPDGIPAQGQVTFRPKNAVKQVVSEGRGVTVTREPVTCTIHQGADQEDDPDPTKGGLLIDEAGAVGGVWLVVGEWTAEYHMEDRYSNIPNVEIIVTEEHTKENPLDVALASELTPTPTQKFVVNEQIYVDTLAARDEVQDNLHNMVISGDVVGDDLQLTRHGGDSIVAGNVRGPRGPQGIQGPMGTLELIGGDNPAITVDTSVGTRVNVGDTMIFYDSGWRTLISWNEYGEMTSGTPIPAGLQPAYDNGSANGNGGLFMRRVNYEVYCSIVAGTMTANMFEFTMPLGFRGSASGMPYPLVSMPAQDMDTSEYTTALVDIGANVFRVRGKPNLRLGRDTTLYGAEFSWSTDATAPTSLPGLPK